MRCSCRDRGWGEGGQGAMSPLLPGAPARATTTPRAGGRALRARAPARPAAPPPPPPPRPPPLPPVLLRRVRGRLPFRGRLPHPPRLRPAPPPRLAAVRPGRRRGHRPAVVHRQRQRP